MRNPHGSAPFPARWGKPVPVAALLAALLLAIALAGCAGISASGEATEGENVIQKISAQEAHDMMTSNEVAVLDVRTPEEYAERHIANARLLTLDTISAETAAAAVPDKDEPVLVYCRSGVRSAEAARKLAALGYTDIYDFGGITTWPYATVEGAETTQSGLPDGELPVGVKVVCGQTKAVPEN